MKLKYYLRGLGIGIIVTALLMGVSKSDAETKTNNDSIKIENEQESQEVQFLEKEKTELAKSEESSMMNEEQTSSLDFSAQALQNAETLPDEQEETDFSEETAMNEIQTPDTADMSEQQVAENWGAGGETQNENNTSYLLHIVRGDDSGTVSRKLQNAGIVENASEFDSFLMQHGYDKRISVGVIEIPMGATWVEVAEKIAGK